MLTFNVFYFWKGLVFGESLLRDEIFLSKLCLTIETARNTRMTVKNNNLNNTPVYSEKRIFFSLGRGWG